MAAERILRVGSRLTGAGFGLLAVLHLLIGLFIVFTYGAKGGPWWSGSEFLPLYDRMGRFGYFLFFFTVVLDAITSFRLFTKGPRYRRSVLALCTSIVNLPILPLGTAMGIIGLALALVPAPPRS